MRAGDRHDRAREHVVASFEDAGMDGEVILPGSAAYESVRKPAWAQYEHVEPVAVVRCTTPADVAESIAVARRLGVEAAPRGGGHSLAGRSATDGVVIDLSPLSAVSVSDGIATVGAGALLGDIDERLAAEGLAIPAGSCPSVGIAGLTLGGGLGFLGRRYGLTADRLSGAQVVVADGRVVECADDRDEELYWALRGAGGARLGVVTSFTFRPVPAPALTCFRLSWPEAEAATMLDAWQAWAPAAPDELAASLLLNVPADPELPISVTLFGTSSGDKGEAERLLAELVARAGTDPTSAVVEQLPYLAAKRYLADNAPGGEPAATTPAAPVPRFPLAFSKSEFFRQPLPGEAVAALVEHLADGRAPGQARELDFTPWGGAYNRVAPDATAFPHRRERFLLKHAVTLAADASREQREAAGEWLARSWHLVRPWGSGGVFPNFAEPALADLATEYYGVNRDRLVRVKARYDSRA